ncbi:MAG TPA: UDP-N-acetylglucosamine 2-epimerase (non-hydrolyzing) [Povalibacter sp.]|nr:UDP-N-acetylglucosamine 2-epimerase (non-hydrolyzing) [Povalibacter sp.]
MSCNIHLIAAARPNFMKIAPLYHALVGQQWCTPRIVHTGQHYDANMSDAFFRDLRLPEPDFHLEVGSGTHAEQTAGVMVAYEKICMDDKPDWVIVVGDVNSTAACAMVAAKLWIPVVHLEAGLRSRDRRMPEEINRLVTDAISDVFWTPSPDADENLAQEGVAAERIDRVGNIMIDSYEMMRSQIEAAAGPKSYGLEPGNYAVVTLHRPSNVDSRDVLTGLTGQLCAIAERLPLLFAVHPRTRRRLEEFDLWSRLTAAQSIRLTEPLGYVEFMALVSGSRAVVTDSGGVQEESTYLGIPCLTLRENTERPITVTQGSNRLVRPEQLVQGIDTVLSGQWPRGSRPQGWDGHTAERCVEALKQRHEKRRAAGK